MSAIVSHSLAIVGWATLDVLFVVACWRYGVVADRAIATRRKLAHLWRRRLPDRTPVVSLAEFKYRPGRRRRRA